ncbi:hypothetical protein Tco_1160306 [Tanacetum coccineum]
MVRVIVAGIEASKFAFVFDCILTQLEIDSVAAGKRCSSAAIRSSVTFLLVGLIYMLMLFRVLLLLAFKTVGMFVILLLFGLKNYCCQEDELILAAANESINTAELKVKNASIIRYRTVHG